MEIINKAVTAAKLLACGQVPLFRRLLRAYFCARRLRASEARPFTYRLKGVPFYCVPGQPDSEYTYKLGEIDRFEFAVLRRWLRPGDAMIDVGANLGLYTFAACHALAGRGSFLAIEASDQMATLLTNTARTLGWSEVHVEPKAVGDAIKEVVFYIASPGLATCEQSLMPDENSADFYQSCLVQMTTLADIVKRHPVVSHPALVKIDIEGAEMSALRGAPSDWFCNSGPLWIIELNPRALARNNTSCAAITDHFKSGDFECWLVPHFSMGSDIRNPPARALRSDEPFTDAQFYNLIAVPRATQLASRREKVAQIFR